MGLVSRRLHYTQPATRVNRPSMGFACGHRSRDMGLGKQHWPSGLTRGDNAMDGLDKYHTAIAEIADAPRPYPAARFSGAGIVTCAGGSTYFTCGWVLVNTLRSLGCQLPIEVWYRSRAEMSPRMKDLMESVDGVRCIDASQVFEPFSTCRLNGWETKPFAVMHSAFEEVIFIDSDNVPTRDPSFLLRTPEYEQSGAIFWPDRYLEGSGNGNYRTITDEAWEACDVPRRAEPEFESGQMVIDKRRCWAAVTLTMFYNEHSDFFYRWLLGDKDTFHMAWRRIGQDFAMPRYLPVQDGQDGPVLYQHDFAGRRLFQHRNQDKWSYDGGNQELAGFAHEETCRAHLEALRQRWDGVVRKYPDDYTPAERVAYQDVVQNGLFHYEGNGLGSRLVELRRDFAIGLGRDKWETHWAIEEDVHDGVHLILLSNLRTMCILAQNNGGWAGRCLHFGREPIAMKPVSRMSGPSSAVAELIRAALPGLPDQRLPEVGQLKGIGTFVYRRVGHDCRPLHLRCDHTIGCGSSGCEQWWYVDPGTGVPELVICGSDGQTCRLRQQQDGVWSGSWIVHERMPVDLVPVGMALGVPRGAPAVEGRGDASYYAAADAGRSELAYYAVPGASREELGYYDGADG